MVLTIHHSSHRYYHVVPAADVGPVLAVGRGYRSLGRNTGRPGNRNQCFHLARAHFPDAGRNHHHIGRCDHRLDIRTCCLDELIYRREKNTQVSMAK